MQSGTINHRTLITLLTTYSNTSVKVSLVWMMSWSSTMFACFSPFKREAVKQDIHVILKRIKMFYINWLFFFFFLVTWMIIWHLGFTTWQPRVVFHLLRIWASIQCIWKSCVPIQCFFSPSCWLNSASPRGKNEMRLLMSSLAASSRWISH